MSAETKGDCGVIGSFLAASSFLKLDKTLHLDVCGVGRMKVDFLWCKARVKAGSLVCGPLQGVIAAATCRIH